MAVLNEIISFATSPYSQYLVALGAGGDGGFQKSVSVEGPVTRLIYRVPTGHTSLEVLRNYEGMLADAGFTKTFELANSGMSGYDAEWFGAKFYWQSLPPYRGDPSNPFVTSTVDGPATKNPNYVTAKATKGGQDMTVAVYVVESSGFKWKKPGAQSPITINSGEVLVGVDLVTAKAVENKMVEVKAADMADALATKGFVDLYGILFDVDRTAIKQESDKTLDEVGTLLKIDRSLKLEVSGHTDNTGDKNHNQKLSEGRAAAVVQVLTTKYGIDASRLKAKGYGDTKPVAPNANEEGRAKNRRVELRKI